MTIYAKYNNCELVQSSLGSPWKKRAVFLDLFTSTNRAICLQSYKKLTRLNNKMKNIAIWNVWYIFRLDYCVIISVSAFLVVKAIRVIRHLSLRRRLDQQVVEINQKRRKTEMHIREKITVSIGIGFRPLYLYAAKKMQQSLPHFFSKSRISCSHR